MNPENEDVLGSAILGALHQVATTDEEEDHIPEVTFEDGPQGSISANKSMNLLKLRRAKEAIINEEISMDDYADAVEEFLDIAIRAFKSFDATKKARRSGDKAQVYQDSKTHLLSLCNSLERMLKYADTGHREDIEEGMETAEQAISGIAQTRDRALALGGRV